MEAKKVEGLQVYSEQGICRNCGKVSSLLIFDNPSNDVLRNLCSDCLASLEKLALIKGYVRSVKNG